MQPMGISNLHPGTYAAQGQYLQQNQNMYGPDGAGQPQQSQSPKPHPGSGHDGYDQAQAQQQLLRT